MLQNGAACELADSPKGISTSQWTPGQGISQIGAKVIPTWGIVRRLMKLLCPHLFGPIKLPQVIDAGWTLPPARLPDKLWKKDKQRKHRAGTDKDQLLGFG